MGKENGVLLFQKLWMNGRFKFIDIKAWTGQSPKNYRNRLLAAYPLDF